MIPGKDINLWAIERSDLMQNYYWANDPEIVKLTGMVPFPKSSWDVDRWYESLQGNNSIFTYAIKLNNGDYIGNIEISNIDWRTRKGEIGVMLGGDNTRGKGLGSQAIKLLTGFAFEQMNFNRIYARILEFNNPAIKAFTKCGYIKEGEEREGFYIDGKYYNVLMFSILKKEYMEKFRSMDVKDSTN